MMQQVIKSFGAVVAGLAFIVISHNAADKILEAMGVFPPPEEGLHVTWMLLLATAYRTVLSIAGCYLTAFLAPGRPMLHALILGLIGLVGASAAAIVVIPMDLSPAWYPVALAALALPCAWIGGKLRQKQLPL
ncbi:hypothetical protein [Leptolyngbya sp. 7M]|uniref:hypothetical protein n=1 Tax=Leptolyngbya sp. 7M TaxID=2812896 RepID=UPI001B8C0979|nr:hypothetical protein [Leptolyngbya sp. 7M]QYO66528.1 hypothetical protein JVX88_06930 [Leptolyngbya sp. 7M]